MFNHTSSLHDVSFVMQYTFILVCCSSLFYVTHGHSVETMLCTLKKKKIYYLNRKEFQLFCFFHETSWRKKKQFCWRSTSNDTLNGFYQAHRRVFSTFRVFAPDLQLIMLTLGALQLSKQCACWSHCCLIKSIVIWFDICHVTTLSLI